MDIPGDDLRRQLEKYIKQLTPTFNLASRLVRDAERITLPFRQLADLQRQLQRHWDSIALLAEQLKDQWDREMPENWKALEPSQVHDVVDIMARTGLGLCWVPREKTLREILAASDDSARVAIVETREAEILEDLQDCLTEVTAPALRDAKGAAEEALAAFRAGFKWSAQALVAATLTSVAEEHVASNLGKVRQDFRAVDPMQETGPLRDLRILALLVGMAKSVLGQFRRSVDPVPDTFNRHASLHAVVPRQYTPRNALAAMLLLVSLLRELHEREDNS